MCHRFREAEAVKADEHPEMQVLPDIDSRFGQCEVEIITLETPKMWNSQRVYEGTGITSDGVCR